MIVILVASCSFGHGDLGSAEGPFSRLSLGPFVSQFAVILASLHGTERTTFYHGRCRVQFPGGTAAMAQIAVARHG